VRFDEARSLLAKVPERLPPMPEALGVTALGMADGQPPRFPRFSDTAGRAAAVLILIFPGDKGEARLVLTQRSPGEHRHAGQISLPGGAMDDDDESVEAAALREAFEEVGLDAKAAEVEVAGVLPQADVRVSGFVVHPVIAFAPREPALMADGYEVAAVFTAPLAAFLPDAPVEVVTANRDGYRLRYGAYPIGDHMVWGATGMLLGRLGAYLASVRERAPGA
jgi:8-oxo-dGTP pyrophosphatase MutT (NUDIX family)